MVMFGFIAGPPIFEMSLILGAIAVVGLLCGIAALNFAALRAYKKALQPLVIKREMNALNVGPRICLTAWLASLVAVFLTQDGPMWQPSCMHLALSPLLIPIGDHLSRFV